MNGVKKLMQENTKEQLAELLVAYKKEVLVVGNHIEISNSANMKLQEELDEAIHSALKAARRLDELCLAKGTLYSCLNKEPDDHYARNTLTQLGNLSAKCLEQILKDLKWELSLLTMPNPRDELNLEETVCDSPDQ